MNSLRALLRPSVASFVSLLLVAVTGACGGQSTPPPTPPVVAAKNAPPREVHEHVVPHTCGTRTKLAQMLGRSNPAPPPDPHETADSAQPPPAGASSIGPEVYRRVAPGVVLVQTKDGGFGTGVVIDPRGYVLTNNHVIASGETEEFVVKVKVEFGDITPTGRMSREEKRYEGVVVKADPVRDLAIVKVIDPPPKLTVVKLANSAPQVGEKVLSIGNAGIGFMWAAKSCNVASIGERLQDESIIAAQDCTPKDPSQPAKVLEAEKKSCEDRKKALAARFQVTNQGLTVQTDCAITHGDSGGPLVNAAGDIVGLNQSLMSDVTTVSFHVHVDEIRDFARQYGDEGMPLLPDPLCDGGSDPQLADIDLDGIPETVITQGYGYGYMYGGYGRSGVLIDLDEDHFAKPRGKLDPFEAEIALLTVSGATYVWYDTDNDGFYDVLLFDKQNDGKPEAAYKLDPQGHILKSEKLPLPEHDLDISLIQDKSLHARLGKIAQVVGKGHFTSPEALAAGASNAALPDPILGAGTQGQLMDTDYDGKPDTVVIRGLFAHGMLIDANERSIGSLSAGESAEEALKAKKVEAQVAVLSQETMGWAFYDTDNDGRFDLVLQTDHATSSGHVTAAWRLGPGGERTPAPEQLGRKLLRPGLVALPRVRGAMRYAGGDVAVDEGAGSLPNPRPNGSRFRFRELAGFPKSTVIEAVCGYYQSSGCQTVTLIDSGIPTPSSRRTPTRRRWSTTPRSTRRSRWSTTEMWTGFTTTRTTTMSSIPFSTSRARAEG